MRRVGTGMHNSPDRTTPCELVTEQGLNVLKCAVHPGTSAAAPGGGLTCARRVLSWNVRRLSRPAPQATTIRGHAMGTTHERPAGLTRAAMIGTYPPRQCGIAAFTADLCEALAAISQGTS